MISLASLAVIALALGLGGFVKGVAGMGLPLLGMPVLASFLGVPHAVAVMMLPIILSNSWQVFEHRAESRAVPFIYPMIIASIPGVGLGTWALVSMPEKLLSLVLGLLVLAYIALRLLHPSFTVPLRARRVLVPVVGFFTGVLQAGAGISSPVLVTFMHALRLARPAYVFAISALFLFTTALQLPAIVYAGVMTGERFVESLVALVPVAIAMPLGSRLGKRIRPEVFDRLVLALLAVIAVKLLYDGLK